ncbi:MAG: bifunctional folylpolyglutamate synthase/dihydrofolate synthase [Candidatus Riflebacteria bacterium]|nr:bifunctional folylpolyglutamate synthase/dihydrofolate synthase [Candidatus Riflebacteria bacterium]
MKIHEATRWILDRGTRTGPYGLDRINFLLEELGNPQNNFACVLIGGTNGKGSVTAITESILLQCEDYVTGSFTSPHLVDIRERIKIQGQQMSDKLWVNGTLAIQEVAKVMEKEPSIGAASFFEAVASLAFWGFNEAEIDLAIVEVGLGGRFDSTNACSPEVSVITNIGTDHQEFLGIGKLAIANEKLGILRKKRPLITGEKSPEILEEFEKACRQKDSQLIVARPGKEFTNVESRPDGHLIKLSFCDEPIFLALPGEHQLENLAIALELVGQLRKHGFAIPDEAVCKGIEAVKWPGRLQWIEGNPPILLDGAHNAEGLETLVSYLRDFPPPAPLNIIFGALKDKPFVEMAAKLSSFGHRLCFVPPACNRTMTRETFGSTPLADKWQWFDTLSSALTFCRAESGSILITGSLYLISDALKELGKQ